MRKILTLFSCVCVLGFFGCADMTDKMPEPMYQSTFVTIENNVNYRVVYSQETKVMYAVSNGEYNRGTFTLLVNPDGTPMLYKEE